MKQAYLTSHGKVIIEKNTLYVRNTKQVFTSRQFAKIAFPSFLIIRFVLLFFEEESPGRNRWLVLFGFLSLFYGIDLIFVIYKALFVQSFSRRIPLEDIISFRIEEDPGGQETHLYLKLRSGKERKITFRKLEKQYEGLAELLSQYLTSLKFA